MNDCDMDHCALLWHSLHVYGCLHGGQCFLSFYTVVSCGHYSAVPFLPTNHAPPPLYAIRTVPLLVLQGLHKALYESWRLAHHHSYLCKSDVKPAYPSWRRRHCCHIEHFLSVASECRNTATIHIWYTHDW